MRLLLGSYTTYTQTPLTVTAILIKEAVHCMEALQLCIISLLVKKLKGYVHAWFYS